MPPHSDHAEVAFVVIYGAVGLLGLVSMVRTYGWLPWKWPWGVWFRRRP